MAFGINIETKFGIPCTYWKISQIQKDSVSESAYIILYGYSDKKISDDKKVHLEPRYINIYPKDYQEVFGIEKLSKEGMNDTKSLYEFIKANFEDFKDAEFIE